MGPTVLWDHRDEITASATTRTVEDSIAEAVLKLTSRVDVDHICDAVRLGVERVFAPRMIWIALHDEAADMLQVRSWRGRGAEMLRNAKVTGAGASSISAVRPPAGYDISHGGEERDRTGVFRRILIALGIGLLLMCLVHVVQFESFLDPLPVVLSLPLSIIGAMLALLITGSTLNIMSMIGLILLMGIVAKNAILLIDFVKAAERHGVCRRTAIIEAGRARLRPILMTTFAVLAGMLPGALGMGEGADFRAPLGR